MKTVSDDIKEIIENKSIFKRLDKSDILVTGATGLIGSMIIKTLLYAIEEYGLDIKIIGQVRNIEKAKQIFSEQFDKIEFTEKYEVACDYIIHTISPTKSKYFIENPVETIKSSVGSTMEILEVANNNKASMVYLSSMEQYGVPYVPGQEMTEDKVGVIDHLNIRASYSESKRLCECLCASYAAEYGLDVKIARLAQTFGTGTPISDNRMPMQFANAVVNRNNIILHTDGESISNFVYLTDAITGILIILLDGAKGNAYNVCNDQETRSVKMIAELVCSDVAKGNICVQIQPLDNMGYAPNVNMYLNSEKLRNLGWTAKVSMADAYRRLVEYLKENMDTMSEF